LGTFSVTGENASVSSGRITKRLIQLSQILDFAIDMQYLSKNPARKSDGALAKISLPKTDKTGPVTILPTGLAFCSHESETICRRT
jgi:hypothetical protein